MFTLQGEKRTEPCMCFNLSAELMMLDQGRELATNLCRMISQQKWFWFTQENKTRPEARFSIMITIKQWSRKKTWRKQYCKKYQGSLYFSTHVSTNFEDEKKNSFPCLYRKETGSESPELGRFPGESTGKYHLASAHSLILEKSNTMKTAAAATKQVLKIRRLIGPTFTH